MTTEITTMTEDEARQFAEATLLETIRGDMGDFSLRIVRKGGAYTVEMTADPKEGPCFSCGDSFAEAWIGAGDDAGRVIPFPVIQGGR